MAWPVYTTSFNAVHWHLQFTGTWYTPSFSFQALWQCLVTWTWISQMTNEPVHLARFVIPFYDLDTGCKILTRQQRAGTSMSSTAVAFRRCPARALGRSRTELLHKMTLILHLPGQVAVRFPGADQTQLACSSLTVFASNSVPGIRPFARSLRCHWVGSAWCKKPTMS